MSDKEITHYHTCTKHLGGYYKCVYGRVSDGKHWLDISKQPRGKEVSDTEWNEIMDGWRASGGKFERKAVLKRG